jgi:epoxyqueuosine reductase QueG
VPGQKESEKQQNLDEVHQFFVEQLEASSYQGIVGVASFDKVYKELMPVQQEKLKDLTGEKYNELTDSGSILSIAVAYPGSIIDCINISQDGDIDYGSWNKYAKEYHRLNELLNAIAQAMADRFEGVAIPPTIEGVASKVEDVTYYYPLTISHRVVAEHAGLGWRGKNGLLINDKYSCAIRFASIATSLPLPHGKGLESKCGDCTACEDACTFIKYRNQLKDYRENCRRYLVYLGTKGLSRDVCGKCIQACLRRSIFKDHFILTDSGY